MQEKLENLFTFTFTFKDMKRVESQHLTSWMETLKIMCPLITLKEADFCLILWLKRSAALKSPAWQTTFLTLVGTLSTWSRYV